MKTKLRAAVLATAQGIDTVITNGKAPEWYAVHLCDRPLDERNLPSAERFAGHRRYMLGRETAIQKMRWTKDGWLVPDNEGVSPQLLVDAPMCAASIKEQPLAWDDFDRSVLDLDYQSLRIPMDNHYISLTARPGWLRMCGRSGLPSYFSQALIARRMME